MQIFEQTLKVAANDLDELNHVNNVRYLQWVQDIAKAHWVDRAPKSVLDTFIWVVVNHNIHYKSPAVLNDLLILKTYVTESKGVTSIRIVEIYHKETQKLIIHCETKWCLLDKTTLRPTRLTQEIIQLFS